MIYLTQEERKDPKNYRRTQRNLWPGRSNVVAWMLARIEKDTETVIELYTAKHRAILAEMLDELTDQQLSALRDHGYVLISDTLAYTLESKPLI